MNAAALGLWSRILAWAAIIAISLYVMGRIHYTLLLFGVAGAMTYLLLPWVRWVYEGQAPLLGRPGSWTGAVLIVFLALPLLFGGVALVAVPAVSQQIDTISESQESLVTKLSSMATYWQARFDRLRLPPRVKQHMQHLVEQVVSRLGEVTFAVVAQAPNFLLSAAYWVFFLLMALLVSLFMLLNVPEMSLQFYEQVPPAFREDVRDLAEEINVIFGGFLKGTAILSVINGVLVLVALSVLSIGSYLGIPGFVPSQYSVLLGFLGVILYPIPIVGIAVLSLSAMLTAWLEGGSALYVCLVTGTVVVSSVFVDRVISPRIMSSAIGVSPLFIMFAALAGAELLGFWGMLLGVPVAAALKLVFRYVRNRFLIVPTVQLLPEAAPPESPGKTEEQGLTTAHL